MKRSVGLGAAAGVGLVLSLATGPAFAWGPGGHAPQSVVSARFGSASDAFHRETVLAFADNVAGGADAGADVGAVAAGVAAPRAVPGGAERALSAESAEDASAAALRAASEAVAANARVPAPARHALEAELAAQQR